MALSFSKILWGLLMALSPVIVGGDLRAVDFGLALVDGWGGYYLWYRFFWCFRQSKVVYFVEFYAFRVLRAFVVFYQ
ncbi:hypothetical protein [Bartonella sp. AP9QHHD]|uniref:hypothetical protein n=1 Tax=Bartonella sp. AP9QHHD TaxID=3243507 RepID=UPI0035CEB5F2